MRPSPWRVRRAQAATEADGTTHTVGPRARKAGTEFPHPGAWIAQQKGADAFRIDSHRTAYHGVMTKAITVRLDEADHAALARQADQLRVSPGTLARMLVHAGLGEDTPARRDARAAIASLVRRSQQRPPADAVSLVDDARTALRSHG